MSVPHPYYFGDVVLQVSQSRIVVEVMPVEIAWKEFAALLGRGA